MSGAGEARTQNQKIPSRLPDARSARPVRTLPHRTPRNAQAAVDFMLLPQDDLFDLCGNNVVLGSLYRIERLAPKMMAVCTKGGTDNAW
jgi:hypothetical protein